MEKYPIAASLLEKFYGIDGKQFERQYKEHLSDYNEWDQLDHADKWLIFPENMGPHLSIDETALSDGELYTIVTNKDAKGKKGALVAIVAGTASEVVYTVLWKIAEELRYAVEEITLDLSHSMSIIARLAFPNATQVRDRFHVQKLAIEALQDMRVDFRWDAIRQDNALMAYAKSAGVPYQPEVFENGDTVKQLLARSRYLLFKTRNNWSASQKKRAEILFNRYPDLETAYNLVDGLRRIYMTSKTADGARPKLALWYNKVEEAGYDSFRVLAETIRQHNKEILNFFINRSTNASAESFNAKIKNFRAQLRGVTDVKFFLYRLAKIYA